MEQRGTGLDQQGDGVWNNVEPDWTSRVYGTTWDRTGPAGCMVYGTTGTGLDQQGVRCMEHRGIYRRINDFWSPRAWSVERAIAEAFDRLTGNQRREAGV